MSNIVPWSCGAPGNPPSCDTIVQLCDPTGFDQNGVCFEVEGIPRFWIKYGAPVVVSP